MHQNGIKLKQKNHANRILIRMEDPVNKLMKIVDRFVAL